MTNENLSRKDRVVSFVWQHVWLLVSLYIMTVGVAVCVRSMLGSSVISVIPYVMQDAGDAGFVPQWTIGQYTWLMNCLLVVGQMIVLRKDFEMVQLFQLLVGFVFGSFIDLNMWLTSWMADLALWQEIMSQVLGCTILAYGIAMEVRCGSVTMPGEGLPVAISRKIGVEFPKVKIFVDISLVAIGVVLCFVFFGRWLTHIIGIGTLFAMVYVGFMVRMSGKTLDWFNCVLGYRPGFRRYVYGLARFIKRENG